MYKEWACTKSSTFTEEVEIIDLATGIEKEKLIASTAKMIENEDNKIEKKDLNQ
jgi:hypothetical protein